MHGNIGHSHLVSGLRRYKNESVQSVEPWKARHVPENGNSLRNWIGVSVKDPKVGERVAVYHCGRMVGKITDIDENGLLSVNIDSFSAGSVFHGYSKEQCRRLVPKKRPKRFWLAPPYYYGSDDDNQVSFKPREGWIEVVEVLKKD